MARRYAPLYTSIWQDETVTALNASAQRIYLVALSQPNMQWCGVVPFTARRWASYAKDTTAKQVARDVQELVNAGLVLLDGDTEELWVRSFIKHNVLDQPKLLNAARREMGEVLSPRIRQAIATAYGWASDTPPDGQPEGTARGSSRNGESCVLDVGVRDQGQEEKPFTENTNTNTELIAWIAAEANRQADAWLAKDRNALVDRDGWVAKRIRTLSAKHTELPASAKRQLRVVCPNPDCIDGFDYGEDVACAQCKNRASA